MQRIVYNTVLAALLVAMAVFGGGSAVAGPFDIDLDDIKEGLEKAQKIKEAADDIQEAAEPWTYPEERATGRVLAARVAASFGGLWRGDRVSETWTSYVNMIGRALVPYCKRPDIKYRFAILNTDQVNAYSCPGGYIFVTKGLLTRIEDEAQLAGVLAHEIGHVSQRHIEKEVKKSRVTAAVLDHGLDFAAGEGEITAEQAEAIKKISDVGWEVLVKKGYAKADEFEADEAGTKNAYKLGYSPQGLKSFIRALGKDDPKGKMKILLSTHPAPAKRVKKLDSLIRENSHWKMDKPRLAGRFRHMKSKYPLH